MKFKTLIITVVFFTLLYACQKNWNEHYNFEAERSNTNMWDALQNEGNLSLFVSALKDLKYDTLFLTNNTYTIFAPNNDAFSKFLDTGKVTKLMVEYLISNFFVQSGNVQGKRKIQTLGEKYALIEGVNSTLLFDGIPVSYESPLNMNGKYFILDKIPFPKPNLYEYIAISNPILKNYIDSQDSIALDRELSRPIGFDKDGNTIYDTVSFIYNKFEENFFPVKMELRAFTATIVFPKQEDYFKALDEMALALGSNYADHNDISLSWQNKILIPYLLEQGIFLNMLEESEFLLGSKDTLKLKNILGDSIVIDYMPAEKTLCSNGYAYNYSNFKIPDTLYAGSSRFEGEWLLKSIGINRYTWKEEVIVSSDIAFEPSNDLTPTASNDTILKVGFSKGYKGKYTVEFNVSTLFPRKYLMTVHTNVNLGGIFEFYINDVLVKSIDYYDYTINKGIYNSVVPGKRYITDKAGFNYFDCWVENLTDYGACKVKIVYTGPSLVRTNGLVIDYIDFLPSK